MFQQAMMSDSDDQENSQSLLPIDVTFPHEQNAYLKVKIQDLENENARLKTRLSDREKQLEKAQKQLESKLAHCSGSSQIAASKVAELSKKIRELTSELESEKSKSRSLYNQLLSKNEVEIHNEQLCGGAGDQKDLECKLTSANTKIADLKSECKFLRQEMKNVQKIIQQEIGEDLTMSDLIKKGTEKGWKGRAQTISMLNSRITSLKAQLAKAYAADKDKIDTKTSALQKAQEATESMAKHKSELQEKCKLQEEKLEATKARRDSLLRDVKCLKQQLGSSMAKCDEQEKVIEVLNNKVRHLEEAKKKLSGQLERKSSDSQLVNEDLVKLRAEIDAKNEMVEELADREEKLLQENANLQKSVGNANLYESIIKQMNDLENQSLKSMIENLNKRIEEQTHEQMSMKNTGEVSPSTSKKASAKTNLDSIPKLNKRVKNLEKENEMLKDTIQRTMKAKDEDIKLFYTLLEQTRKLFFESLNLEDKANPS